MSEKCEMLEKCGFFLNFRGNTEVVKNGWIRIYCSKRKTSEYCVRKKIKKETGMPPADNMSPTGNFL